MTPILSALLSLGLCLDQRMWAQADLPPRPFLRADTGPLVSLGRRVTLRCRGSRGAEMYVLEKGQESGRMVIQDMKPSGIEGEFPIPSVTAQDAGIYSCRYNHSSGWSQPSHPLKLVVTVPVASQSSPTQPQLGLWGGGSGSAIPGFPSDEGGVFKVRNPNFSKLEAPEGPLKPLVPPLPNTGPS
ncbi:leukocyte-associated immunoglobulin-like receptor 2 [Macrotis lagotis]|uniref:leukocyte-associated immunoglobulin-like receptor 2 n=1 Tax=Macrotis lagotis TaxID=92651 RepID=UPI003D695C4D